MKQWDNQITESTEYVFSLKFSGRVYSGTISVVTVGKFQPKRKLKNPWV